MNLPYSEYTKILGVTFDCSLQWNQHIDGLCRKLRSQCYGLNFMSHHCSKDILRTLYFANIHSHLKYGILNWGNSTNMHRVFILQKYAIRIIASLKMRDSCRDSFRNLKILTVPSIYVMEACCYVFTNKHVLLSNNSKHNYETRGRDLVHPGYHRTSKYQKTFIYSGCKFFNHLGDDIKLAPTLPIFKRKLKKILLERTCYSTTEFFI